MPVPTAQAGSRPCGSRMGRACMSLGIHNTRPAPRDRQETKASDGLTIPRSQWNRQFCQEQCQLLDASAELRSPGDHGRVVFGACSRISSVVRRRSTVVVRLRSIRSSLSINRLMEVKMFPVVTVAVRSGPAISMCPLAVKACVFARMSRATSIRRRTIRGSWRNSRSALTSSVRFIASVRPM